MSCVVNVLIIATRTASQLRKGKYVESEDEEDLKPYTIKHESEDEDIYEEDLESLSDVPDEAASPPLATYDDDEEDLYGVPPPEASTSRTPASKRRKVTSSASTPISTKSKSSASSLFSPMDSVVDTPATSVSGSISSNPRSSTYTLQTSKRKFETLDPGSEESEFEMDEEEEEEKEDDDQDGSLSIAPTVSSSDQPLATAVAQARTSPAHARRGRRGRKFARMPQISQWEKTHIALCEFHPELACIWDELEMEPTIQPVAVPQPEGLSLRLLPFQLEGLDWLLKQEQQARFVGGILADEMGMGKTIQTIALLLAEPRGKPNLVVAPTVALMQWKSEIETHTNNGLSVCLFYGANRSVTAKELKNYDVVLTTCTPHLSLINAKLKMLFWRVCSVNKTRGLRELMGYTKNVLYYTLSSFSASSLMKHIILKTERVTPQKPPLHSKHNENSVSPAHPFKIEFVLFLLTKTDVRSVSYFRC